MTTKKAVELAINVFQILKACTSWPSDADDYRHAADTLQTLRDTTQSCALCETHAAAMDRLQEMGRSKHSDYYVLWNETWERWECRNPYVDEQGEYAHRGWFGDTPEAAINAAWEAWKAGQK